MTHTKTQVTANPELRGVVARGASMLPTRTVERAFRPLYGQPLNFVAFGKAVKKLDDWYQQRGILGQVGMWVWCRCVGGCGCVGG
jgi:outer membrane protein insertion porin family